MRIIILGPTGMLFSAASRFFRDHYDVELFSSRYSLQTRREFLRQLTETIGRTSSKVTIINAIGSIPQRKSNDSAYVVVNALLPHDLAQLANSNVRLIQPSTDCIFSGSSKSGYFRTDDADTDDCYGLSRYMSELFVQSNRHCVIVRTSIIGPDSRSSGQGFMGWILSRRPGEVVNGYENHWWNGITTLRWCEYVHSTVIPSNLSGVVSVRSSECVSKLQLALMIRETWGLPIRVNPYVTATSVNRCITDAEDLGNIRDQLEKIKIWTDQSLAFGV